MLNGADFVAIVYQSYHDNYVVMQRVVTVAATSAADRLLDARRFVWCGVGVVYDEAVLRRRDRGA
jgi:hypothetical protein